MKKKLFFVLLMTAILVSGFCGCKSEAEKQAEEAKKNWAMTSNEERMGIYCALIKEYLLLVEDFGEETPYPAMRRSVKGSMMSGGMTQEEALDNAEKVLIEEQSVFWHAEEKGIIVMEADVETYIRENVIDQLKQSDGYELADEACRKEGISFEDSVWAYKNSYKMEYVASLLGINGYEDFQVYKEEAVKAYRETQDYTDFQRILRNCRKLIEEDITDKDVIQAEDIYLNAVS